LIEKVLHEDQSEMIEKGYKIVQDRSIDKIGEGLKQAYQEVIKIKR
jgi:1,2-diacylglycerol-3-alpha-glucose alpha-1,2-glucosyltransferase